MAAPAGGGIGIASPFAMAPFEHGETRTIDPFVDHARRHQHFIGGSRRREKGKFGLTGAGRLEIRGRHCTLPTQTAARQCDETPSISNTPPLSCASRPSAI